MSIVSEFLNEFLKRRDTKKAEFSRVLSFGDYFHDRFEKAKYLGFGEGSSIYDSALVFGDVRVGKNVWIGPNVILDGSGGTLEIGDHCDISAGVQIYTHDTKDRALFGQEISKGSVKIGEHTYIGPNAIITSGRTIGPRAVVGALSLVLEDVPAESKAYGIPAKIKGSIRDQVT